MRLVDPDALLGVCIADHSPPGLGIGPTEREEVEHGTWPLRLERRSVMPGSEVEVVVNGPLA